jgi:AcrR family transcriptional regulator
MTKIKQAITKDETYWKVLDAAVELDFRKGHLRWTMSDLSRLSGVTRSLVYYYFGSEKMAILQDAAKLIGEEFFGLNEQRLQMWKNGKISASVISSRRLLEQRKYMAAFYLVHRTAPTAIGESLRGLEAEYTQKLQRFFPTLSAEVSAGIFGLFFGLVIGPNIGDDIIVRVVDSALKQIKLA